MDFTYGFNSGSADNGNVASITNNINTARSQSYTYDELNRISVAQTTATSGTYSWGLAFTYDPWANLLSASVTQGSAYSFSVYADGANRIHNTGGTFTYDAAGNLTADPVNSSYSYNAEGELTSVAGVTYTYDGDGNRVKKSTGKLYWYGATVDPMAESDASGNLTNEYVFLSGTRIAMLTLSSGVVNYYVHDHLGSSHIVTNSAGTILDDSDFYPFGGERSYTSSSGNNYKFTGKEHDAESGLDDFAARFYTSNYGRFLSPDESKYSKPADPQTWNLYGYVANNPINAVDPTGHAPQGWNGMPVPKVEEHGGDPADMGGEGAGGGEGPADSNSGTDTSSSNPGSDTKYYLFKVTESNGDQSYQWVAAANSKDAYTAILTKSELCESNSPTVVPTTMSLSLEGSNFIKAHEGGFKDKTYNDTAGNPTIGYGHKLNGESFPNGISESKASELFAQDIGNAVRLVTTNINVPLNQHQFDAMVSLAYNLRNFSSSGIVGKINEMGTITKGDFTKYNHSGGVEVRGLTIRRTDEFNLFSKGDYH